MLQQCVMLQGIVGTRSHEHEDNGPMINAQSSEVSSTHKQRLVPPFSLMHKDNGTIGNKDNQDSDDLNSAHMVEEKKQTECLNS